MADLSEDELKVPRVIQSGAEFLGHFNANYYLSENHMDCYVRKTFVPHVKNYYDVQFLRLVIKLGVHSSSVGTRVYSVFTKG